MSELIAKIRSGDLCMDVENLHPKSKVLSSIKVHFVINTEQGFDCLSSFTLENNYKKPEWKLVKVRGSVINEAKLKKLLAKNKARTTETEHLVAKLRQIATFDEYSIKPNLLNTDSCYEWVQQPQLPCDFFLEETSQKRIRDIWLHNNLLNVD